MFRPVETGEGHLVRAPRALDALAVDAIGAGPALGRLQHDHRPARAIEALRAGRPLARAGRAQRARHAMLARVALDLPDAGERGLERRRHSQMHLARIVSADEMRLVAVAAQQLSQLVVADAREHRRIGDLPAVQVQDRQHRPIGRRIDELVRMPAGGERGRLRLAVADHAGDHEPRVVERRAPGVRQRVAQLAALVDRPRHLGRHMARHAVGPRELAKQPVHSLAVARDLRIALGVRAFEPGVRQRGRASVAGADDPDHVDVVVADQAVQVRIDEIQPRRRAPVAEQARLDVLAHERLLEQRIGAQVDLAHRQVVRRAPPPIDTSQDLGVDAKGCAHPALPSAASTTACAWARISRRCASSTKLSA